MLTRWIIILFVLPFAANAKNAMDDSSCKVCSRIERISSLINKVSIRYWPEFKESRYRVPLFYFTDKATYMAMINEQTKKHFTAKKVKCDNGFSLYMYGKRIDAVPFHMENKTDIADKASPYYRNPVMFCSDVETANRLIPDITNTEEWMAIVVHEYFHGFQFRHTYIMNFMADSLKESADTLIKLYRQQEWFKNALATENEWLLKALASDNKDTISACLKAYLSCRNNRRSLFKQRMGYDISLWENFWEKIEGTARYVEYYLAYVYKETATNAMDNCDNMFNDYKTYKQKDFESMAWMKDKTQIMPAYYYVIGFNMCRVLDKIGVDYKNNLFDTGTSLTELLEKSLE